jgi:hypothetical protein
VLVIALAVVITRSRERGRREALRVSEQNTQARKTHVLTIEELALNDEDFIIPPMERPEATPEYTPFRPRFTRWSRDLASKYWVAPRDIATEIVESINDRNMQRLFDEVP